jgi:hypothetical protein
MSSRDRKREDRRKRKQRSADRQSAPATTSAPVAATNGSESLEDIAAEAEARGPSRSEIKDEAAREALEPLEEGERPLVVTIGALLSILIALITVVAWALGAEVNGERPNVVQVFSPAILFAVMGIGMWRARYWAVLGFQAVMAIFMVGSFITLVAATTVLQALSVAVVLIGAGALFWFTVKALARIQMPDRRPS